jgi:hypothetical protein
VKQLFKRFSPGDNKRLKFLSEKNKSFGANIEMSQKKSERALKRVQFFSKSDFE